MNGIDWQIRKAEWLRDDLEVIKRLEAVELAPIAYDHDGPHWGEWVAEAGELGVDVHNLLLLLNAAIAGHLQEGGSVTPELLAYLYILKHGKGDAFMRFVGAAWQQGNFPDRHVSFLLLHPELIPENFPMFRRLR